MTTAITPKQDVFGRLENEKTIQTMQAVADSRIDVSRLVAQVKLAVSSNPDLLNKCSPDSIVRSAMTAARMGLSCDGHNGQGYLVPYQGSCVFMPGYQGMIQLAINNGVITGTPMVDVVLEGDEFTDDVVDNIPRIKHVKHRGAGDRVATLKTIVAAYFVGAQPNGRDIVVVREGADIRKIGGGSRSSAWKQWPGSMARKSAVRYAYQLMPKNDLMELAARQSDIVEGVVLGRQARALEAGERASSFDAKLTGEEPETVEVEESPVVDSLYAGPE